MKHLKDDVEYAEQCEVINGLARKKSEIDAEINKLQGSILDDQHPDPIRAAQAIEPGVASGDGGQASRARLSVLQTQSDQLRRAIGAQHLNVEKVQRTAAYRVYAANAATYLKLADQLVSQVEAIVATSEALKQEKHSLYCRGVAEPPNVEFPEYGFNEQLPVWLKSLRSAVHSARLTQQAYSN
jgi:hypothetical protein